MAGPKSAGDPAGDKDRESNRKSDEPRATGSEVSSHGRNPKRSSDSGTEGTELERSSGGIERSGARPAMLQQTRIGAAWIAVAVAVAVLVLLLVFILQNQQQVDVRFFGLQGRLPGGVLVLLSAAGGALLVIVLGMARMIQLRWLARRDRRVVRKKRTR